MRTTLILFIVLLMGCQNNKPLTTKKSHPSHKYTFVSPDQYAFTYFETDYVPVYSDIYHRDGTLRYMLTSTISIRNTSLTDSAFILSANYHDSYGNMLHRYIDSIILLTPLESIEFVVEEEENVGGAGANFIVEWAATNYTDQLLIQSVMIGTHAQQGISFMSPVKVLHKKTVTR